MKKDLCCNCNQTSEIVEQELCKTCWELRESENYSTFKNRTNNKYSWIDEVCDLYVKDNETNETVAAAYFEEEYYIISNDEREYFEDLIQWRKVVKEHFGLN